jgi:hypothetical protein
MRKVRLLGLALLPLVPLMMVACQGSTPKTPAPGATTKAEPAVPDAGAPRASTDAQVAAAASSPVDGGTAQPAEPPAQVRLMVRSYPRMKVYWGKKLLGLTPLPIDRPRDSGPVDLVLRADGYFPVHTRAYTYKSDVISLRATKLADRMKILGAKKDLTPPPEAESNPEAPLPGAGPDAGAR